MTSTTMTANSMTSNSMTNANDNLIAAIDLGSSKTVVLVAEVTGSGLRYRGHGVAESRGSHKGVIADLDRAASSIQKAAEQAENSAGAPIEHAIVGIGGTHVRGVNSQ